MLVKHEQHDPRIYLPMKHACIHLWSMKSQRVLTSGTCILRMYSLMEHASLECTHLRNMHPQHVLTDIVEALHVLILVPGGLGYNVLCEKEKTQDYYYVALRFFASTPPKWVIHLFFIQYLIHTRMNFRAHFLRLFVKEVTSEICVVPNGPLKKLLTEKGKN